MIRTDNSEVIARLTRERDEARAEVERLREENEGLRKTARGWLDSLQQTEKVRDQIASNWMDWQHRAVELESEMDMLEAEVERLAKCCTQRGARMQIMRDFLDAPSGMSPPTEWWYFCEERPEAKNWFDEDGVVV